MRLQALLVACAALAAAGSAQAQAPAAPLQVSYPTDATLSCEQIAGEAARMDALMGAAGQAAANAQGQGKMAELGASAAINGALYSGALGRVPGLGMFANAASGMAKQRAAAAQATAAEQVQTAQMRKTIMMGLYQGKACGAPAAAPVVTPAATAPVPVAAPATGTK